MLKRSESKTLEFKRDPEEQEVEIQYSGRHIYRSKPASSMRAALNMEGKE